MIRKLSRWVALVTTGTIMGVMLAGCAWSIGSDKAHTAVVRPARGQELIDLKKAQEQGAITEEEYQAQKRRSWTNELGPIRRVV